MIVRRDRGEPRFQLISLDGRNPTCLISPDAQEIWNELNAIGSAGPGANHAEVRTAALVLSAVLAELDLRGRTYAKAASFPYSCTCGFSCTGLAAFDEHLDQYPPEGPTDNAHMEK